MGRTHSDGSCYNCGGCSHSANMLSEGQRQGERQRKDKKGKVVKKKKEMDEWDEEFGFDTGFNQFYSSVNTVYRQRLMIKRKRIAQGIGITDLTQEVPVNLA